MTEQYEQWQATTVRTPDDVPPATPARWQAERRADLHMLLSNHLLPRDQFPDAQRGDAGDALTALALGESIRRDILSSRCSELNQALTLGATWRQAAAALGTSPEDARALLRDWTDRQRHAYRQAEAEGIPPFGHDADKHAGVLALLDLADDVAAAEGAPTGAP